MSALPTQLMFLMKKQTVVEWVCCKIPIPRCKRAVPITAMEHCHIKSLPCVLNGEDAEIVGLANKFGIVRRLNGTLEVEFSWEAIIRISERDGVFCVPDACCKFFGGLY